MEIVMFGLEILRRLLSRIGPYLAVEVLLPGGTLLALMLYWHRRQSRSKHFSGQAVDSGPARSTTQ